MIGIVDYGLGNLRSVQGALGFLGAACVVSQDPAVLARCAKLVLPGVGSFRAAMENIHSRGLFAPLREYALDRGIPMLGICLGMQLLADWGEEDGVTAGLGLISGRVRRFPDSIQPLRVPHIGFNDVEFEPRTSSIFQNLGTAADFYFVHSFHFDCTEGADVAAWSSHGIRFASAVQRKHVYGTQFHPEKSQTNGLRVMKNFLDLPLLAASC